MNWRLRAACRDEDPELFFPDDDAVDAAALDDAYLQTEAAKTVCRRCPVLEECRTWALVIRPTTGVFGALTATERRILNDRNRPSRRPAGEPRDLVQLAAVGRRLLAAGRTTRQVGDQLHVRQETARRWARVARREAAAATTTTTTTPITATPRSA